jgi:hypothetical protein
MDDYLARISRLETAQDCGWLLGAFDTA